MIQKASLVKDTILRLGASSRNVLDFSPVKIGEIHLAEKSPLVKRTSLVNKKPELLKECESCIVPPLFVPSFGCDKTEGISSGKRALYLPTHKYVLNLRDLGMSDMDIEQEFVVDIKGAGLRIKDSEKVSKQKVVDFMRRQNIQQLGNVSDLLVFSKNRYLHFNTPEGAQDSDGGGYARETYEYFSALGFKIAPVICTIKYPAFIQKLVEEFSEAESLDDVILVQEKRLMPSFVRASFLEHNHCRNPEIVRMITKNEARLRSLPQEFIDDMTLYFEVIAATTERRGARYYWDCLGNLDGVFGNPAKMYDKPYAWYFAKDIVLSSSGLYFVDLEGALVDQDAKSRDELFRQHRIYIVGLLKDFLRILTQYNIAVKAETDMERIKKIKDDSVDGFLARINETDAVKIDVGRNSTKVTIKYDSIQPQTYTISNEEILISIT